MGNAAAKVADELRSYGTGTVNQLPSGKWRARIPNGRGGYESIGTFATELEACQEALKAVEERARGGVVIKQSRQRFDSFAREWLDHKSASYEDLTKQLIEGVVYNHMNPFFGGYILQDINAQTVDQWWNQIHTRKFIGSGKRNRLTKHSPQRLKCYRTLWSMMDDAVRWEKRRANPCTVAKAEAIVRKKKRPIISDAQAMKLLGSVFPDRQVMIVLAAFGGLRLGEILALTRDHVAADGSSVFVEFSAIEVANGEQRIKCTKTEAGVRLVPMEPKFHDLLARHLDEFTGPTPDAWVNTGPRGGLLRRQQWNAEWKKAKAFVDGVDDGVARLPGGLRFHDLRHYCVTSTKGLGDVKDQMMLVGHDDPAMTLEYTGATIEGVQAIVDAKARRLDGFEVPAGREGNRFTLGRNRKGNVIDINRHRAS